MWQHRTTPTPTAAPPATLIATQTTGQVDAAQAHPATHRLFDTGRTTSLVN